MKKEKKFALNSTLTFQSRNMLFGFVAFCAAFLATGGIVEGVDKVKTEKEFNAKFFGTEKLSKQDKKILTKDVSKDAILTIVALAVVYVMFATLRASKRRNDAAAIRVMRRYIVDMQKTNPELKKYSAVLNNDMALHNIAAGVANKLSISELSTIGGSWDLYHFDIESVEEGAIKDLRLKNKYIKEITDMLKEHAQKDPQFLPYLVKLVESSAKTFSLENYMARQQNVR